MAPRKPAAARPSAGKRKRATSTSNHQSSGDEYGPPRARKQPRRLPPPEDPSDDESSGDSDEDHESSALGTEDAAGSAPRVAGCRRNGGIDYSLPPISDVREMFADMVQRLGPKAVTERAVDLNVATLCSGTEAPIFALRMIQEAMEAMSPDAALEFKHLFSCEIEPFKQGFIRRNLPEHTLIFRDVVELAIIAGNEMGKATTAGGSLAEIPRGRLDILFAGCSCVDYSRLNTRGAMGKVPSLDRHLQPDKNAPKGKFVAGDRLPVSHDEAFSRDLRAGLEELKNLKSAGESARTFFAAIRLIDVLRPNTVILENVDGAPWDLYIKRLFPKLGYVARYVKVDSKNYYLPQTRQRGYLVAINANKMDVEMADKIVSEWAEMLIQCRRRASAPITAFLGAPDDPTTIQARADMENRGACSAAEWALCQLRHQDVRRKNGLLADDNPFSHKAMRNGRIISATYPSHAWLPFWKAQPARIIDLIDIVSATTLQDGVDLAYKTAMIDVSQNADRNPFGRRGGAGLRNLGIVGCITPSGLPVLTDLLRPVTGSEALALQGLAVDELVISTETQAQLRDLAGNAMTATVVGAATLALILSVAACKPDLFVAASVRRPRRGLFLESPDHKSLTPGPAASTPMRGWIQQLRATVREMVRLCYCPTPAAAGFVVCATCGATACSGCTGNPYHNFGPALTRSPTCSPERAKINLRRLVPTSLYLTVPHPAIQHALKTVEEALYRSVVASILKSAPIYYFCEIKVTEVVTVCYTAADSIAHLVLSPDSSWSWYIYIAPWHPERVPLSKISDLGQPIARGQFYRDTTALQWSVWALGRIDLTLRLAKDAAGNLLASHLAFANGRDAGQDASLAAWKDTVAREVHGTYVHHPDCGTPGNALRVKQSSTPGSSSVFILWASARTGTGADDHFVWTGMTPRRTEPHEYREVFLHASPAITWAIDTRRGTAPVYWPGYWSSCPDACPVPMPSGPLVSPADVVRIGWGSTEAIQQASCHVAGQAPAAQMAVFAMLTARLAGFPELVARFSKIDTTRSDHSFYVIPTTQRDAFLKLFAFVSTEVCRPRAPSDRSRFQHLDGVAVPVVSCNDCSVAPPTIIVHVKRHRNAGRDLDGAADDDDDEDADMKKTKIVTEDPDEAARFERQFQDLPRAIAVAARLVHEVGGPAVLQMKVLLQPKVLASRAFANLVQAHRTPSRGSLALRSGANTSFSVTLDYAPRPTDGFAPFRNALRPCGKDSMVGIDVDLVGNMLQNGDMPTGAPPRFSGGAKQPRYALRPTQRESVDWMLQRELAPLDFIKTEVEEEIVRPLNLRIEGRAEWTTRFPYSARGGVVAHEIGYGKTVVMLGLIDLMRGFDTGKSITERKHKVDGAWAEQLPRPFGHPASAIPDTFFVHLSATLVIVPRHITEQWAKEAKRFLGLMGRQLLVIKTTEAFYGGHSLDDLKAAEIIIVSSAVFRPAFVNRLQTVAARGADFATGLGGRGLEFWYQRALHNHRSLVADYLAGRAAGIPHGQLMRRTWDAHLPRLIKEQQEEIDALAAKQIAEIDRLFYKEKAVSDGAPEAAGAARKDKGNARCAKKKAGQAGEEMGRQNWDIAWLHSCSFARIIWDECAYDDEKENTIPLFVANAVANAKWLISGTPKLFNLGDVCRIAAAFGLHIAKPDPRMMPGLPPVTKGLEQEQMSKSEMFHVFSSVVKSADLAHDRHRRAERFVAAYFRANPLEPSLEVACEERICSMAMPPSTAVRYHLLEQEVLDAAGDYAALPAHARGEVALMASDVMAADGRATARMLLGLLACGLGTPRGSIDDLVRDLAERRAALEDQFKFLWDKMMWLRHFIIALKPDTPRFKFSIPVQDTLDRVEALCEGLRKALLGCAPGEDTGDKNVLQHEAAMVACLTSVDPAAWNTHFRPGWMDTYTEDKALYTWIDFFDLDPSTLGTLSVEQQSLLARDLRWFRCKAVVAPTSTSANATNPILDSLPADVLLTCPSRAIPPNIRSLVASGHQLIDGLAPAELEQGIRLCIDAKNAVAEAKRAESLSKLAADQPPPKTNQKLWYTERLAERNLKLTSNLTIPKLKALLLEHECGRTVCDQYRDGRAAPSRHRDFHDALQPDNPVATKQTDAANLELKNTLVHVTKTSEDLRANTLEASFVPTYASLANGNGTLDDLGQTTSCCCCARPLESLSEAFLAVACGHVLCDPCKSQLRGHCPVQDCAAFIRSRPILRCADVRLPVGIQTCTKAEAVTDFIRTSIPADEHILVFVQYGLMVDKMAAVLASTGIRHTNLAAARDDAVAGALETFKAGRGGQVLLLDIDSEISAGANLTIASHIIFVSPYEHADPQHGARIVAQAIGRAKRLGQTKLVHHYVFMVIATIEERGLTA
ncbi:hypothetical protein BT67DRAFT_382302 [Trichocladium antarcticum]|uniref:RING-type domain-containing protein n=1 Tax=Trichocladium antarcticum TaxID=1450529 RepID=A0AAN6UJC2_9PEZI|nr:hypothetical protein BT67DRAFT_382302 [Trichocladium antarcticum]